MSMHLLLVCLALILSSATASTPVLDNDGDEVRTGVAYKIYYYPLPPSLLTQPLSLGKTGENSCPLDVVLKFCRIDSCGLPLSFYPSEGRIVVGESEDVNIKFDASPACPDYSTVWQVVGDEKEEYVSTGGVLGPHDLTTSWFSIKTAELMLPHVYELVYCQRLQSYKHVAAGGRLGICSTLGFNGDRLILQGLGATPFRFKIVKDKAVPTISSVV